MVGSERRLLPKVLSNWLRSMVKTAAGGNEISATVVAWKAVFRIWMPPWLMTTTSPTKPSASSIRTTVITPSSGRSRPSWVPRMPMVATGVLRVMASGSVLATWPLTKVNTPSITDIDTEPSWVPGS